jgi:integrase
MSEKRVHVWTQRFKDRPNLMLQWYDPLTGRRRSQTADTADEQEAEQARADLEYELTHGHYQEVSRLGWPRFRQLFEVEYVSGKRPNTRCNYKATLDLFERLCGPRTLRGITERTISTFVSGMRGQKGRGHAGSGMLASSIKSRLQFLHTTLAWAVSQKLLPAVPHFPSVKPPRKDPQPVPVEAFERLFAKAQDDGPMQAYLLTGWLAGLRRCEALELEWEATETAPYLDYDQDRIVLPAAYVKADKDQWVPLDPALRDTLETLARTGRKVFRFLGRLGKPLTASALSKRIVKLAGQAGVKLSMKVLRRGFGCRYAGKVPAQVLQKLMRHSNIAITMTYYANIDDAVMEAVLGPKNCDSGNARRNKPATARVHGQAAGCLKTLEENG